MAARQIVVAALLSTGAAFAVAGCRGGAAGPESGRLEVGHSGREDNVQRDITPLEARDLMAGERYVYLDVRTVAEYQEGHPSSAWNVPVLETNAAGEMAENPEFLRVVEATFSKDTPLLVGCRSGGRSSLAAQMLQQAGYKRVYNIMGGYAGGRTPAGQELKGWSQLGYPVDRDDGGEKSYTSLRARSVQNP